MQIKPLVALGWLVAALATFPVSAADEHREHREATPRDEARWSTPDTTPQQRYQSARHEAMAAYHDNLVDCKSRGGEDKASCTKEAKARFDEEMGEAKKLLKE
jgi:hypothetical protein